MLRLLLYSVIQSALLAGGQVFLKIALQKMSTPSWTRRFVGEVVTNWHFALSGLLFGSASLLWMYILRHFPLSMAYPMVSLSYVFGMFGAIVFFHEEVPFTRWAGVILIMGGCCLVAR